ncbi:hypothetical protein AB0T07_15715 [Acinetobacter baumannii]|uniref:hypothetical protein n=1 Tax=Acinetobacter baumannii TaxID=470 RepID=UPI000D6E2391|nr:hypothetical protein [Acinetobacter baumannii]HCA5035128.1 hypothetical protein [Acinetobacter baumannii]
MNFENIKSLLENNNWHQVNGERRYISKDDVYLSFWLGEETVIEDFNLPRNLHSFDGYLSQLAQIAKIEEMSGAFEYNSVKLENFKLYKFSGHVHRHGSKKPISVYFTAHPDINDDKTEIDMFSKALIHALNDKYALNLINQCTDD